MSSIALAALAEGCPIDNPIHCADEAGTTDDVAERDRHQIVNDAHHCDDRRVKIRRDITCPRHQPGQRQEIHVGDAVFKAGGDEGGDWKYERNNFVGNRPAGIGKPYRQANEQVTQNSLEE